MKKKKLFPIGISKKVKDGIKNVVFFIIMVAFIFAIVFLSAILTGCNSQNATANGISSQEEMIFELKCKLENQQKLVRAYENVLHEVWLDKPSYVEDALSESDAFCDLNEIMGETDVFQLRNADDSVRYNYKWFHEDELIMVKDSLVTKTQALALKELGFAEPTPCYFWTDEDTVIMDSIPSNSNGMKSCVSVPTIDEVIDWLRRKYNIVIYNKIEPFVDPVDETHKTILFKYGVKRCDINHLGWNGRIDLGMTRLAKNMYSLKREAINIALKYIKSQKK